MRNTWEKMTKIAKPCKVCNEYYPGDCFEDGCRDDKCQCDGCNTYHDMIQGEELDNIKFKVEKK